MVVSKQTWPRTLNRFFADGITQNVVYDMSEGDDFAWGLGLGCEGIIHLMLQRLDHDTGFSFLKTLDNAWQARAHGLLSLVTASHDPGFSNGDFALECNGDFRCGDSRLMKSTHSSEGSQFSRGHDMSRRYWMDSLSTDNGNVELLLIPIMPPPALLICGAGMTQYR